LEVTWDVKTLTIVGLAVAVGLFFVGLFLRSGKKGQADQAGYVFKECLSCGWKGKVSKFHKKCSNCGDSLF
jgi:hypothetical protein